MFVTLLNEILRYSNNLSIDAFTSMGGYDVTCTVTTYQLNLTLSGKHWCSMYIENFR